MEHTQSSWASFKQILNFPVLWFGMQRRAQHMRAALVVPSLKVVKIVQAALPCLLYAVPGPSRTTDNISVLDLRGGTDAPMAPSIGYLQHVLVPMLRRLFGLSVDLQVGQLFHALLCAALTLLMLSSYASVLVIYGCPDAAMAAVVSSLQQVPMYMLRRLYKLTIDLQLSQCQDYLVCLTSTSSRTAVL